MSKKHTPGPAVEPDIVEPDEAIPPPAPVVPDDSLAAKVAAAEAALNKAQQDLAAAIKAQDELIEAQEKERDSVPDHVRNQQNIMAFLESEKLTREGRGAAPIDEAMSKGSGGRPTRV